MYVKSNYRSVSIPVLFDLPNCPPYTRYSAYHTGRTRSILHAAGALPEPLLSSCPTLSVPVGKWMNRSYKHGNSFSSRRPLLILLSTSNSRRIGYIRMRERPEIRLGACAKDTLSAGQRRLRTTGVGWSQMRKKTWQKIYVKLYWSRTNNCASGFAYASCGVYRCCWRPSTLEMIYYCSPSHITADLKYRLRCLSGENETTAYSDFHKII